MWKDRGGTQRCLRLSRVLGTADLLHQGLPDVNDDTTTPVAIGLVIIVAAAIAASILLPIDEGDERIVPADTTPAPPPSTVWQTTLLPPPLSVHATVTTPALRGPQIQLSEPPPAPTTTLPTDPVAIIRWVWPDGPDEDYAVLIAWRESRHDPTARNSCCHGLFQIHWTVHRGWLDDYGIYTANDLLDPWKNVRAALALRQRPGGWNPWSTHR